MKIIVSSYKQCWKNANTGFVVILISSWKNEPKQQQVQNEMNKFYREADCLWHYWTCGLRGCPADVIAYVLVTTCLVPRDQKP